MPLRARRSFVRPGVPLVNPRHYHANPDSSGLLDKPLGLGVWNSPYYLFPNPWSYILDVVGNKGGYKPVDHTIITHSMSELSSWNSPYADGGLTSYRLGGIPFPVADVQDFQSWPWMPAVSDATVSDWSLEALIKFQDQVPTKFSLPNFMYELKDMKSMIPSIDKTSFSKTAANNFLGVEFGVLPFVSDVKAIVSMADQVSKRLKHLIEINGKSTSLSFNRTISYDEPFSFRKSYVDPTNTWRGLDIVFRRLGGQTQFHIGAKLFQDLSDLEDAFATLKALAATGGFNKPARVVWNAIPYSFVVDWFFHVGKLLDTLTVQPFGGTYNVSDVGYSFTTETSYYVTQEVDTSVTGLPTQVFPLGTVSFRAYARRLGYPASSLFLTNGTLSPMQQVLGLAMLEQKRR